ncbi:ATP-grasp domain-containing protein [Marinilabilia rubra]|uniref:ATP-grasp domain-containing protein n=1 Tax=Marinilabilia rubra TaxID=2162893 RepID=A0A2U2B6V3_9BACT|nr:hypothetical protein [Marinilabilia rubra]PWD98764.1 hypothetical protein DDZ16_13575 [Marinilabilia rubra]
MMRRFFLFNPTNEMAIANGQVSYMPPAHLKQFENDLAALPWLMANENDIILVPEGKMESLSHLAQYDLKLPRLISGPEDINNEGINELWPEPWGWSPAVYRSFKPFNDFIDSSWQTHPFNKWDENHKQLLSRETGYELLKTIKNIKTASPGDFDLIFLPEAPMVIDHEADLSKILESMAPPAVIKTPFSASGRGLYRIRNSQDNPEKSPWVKGMLKRQGKVYIEKMLCKVQDVSFQFMLSEKEINYCGHNFFYADPSGQFAGCAIGEPVINSQILADKTVLETAIEQASTLLGRGLKKMNLSHNYWGPAGVDGIFFKHSDGRLLLQPCLEINLRHNMGMANIFFKKKLHPEAIGSWQTGLFQKEEWKKFCHEKKKSMPVILCDGKIRHGFLPFVSPENPQLFGAWLTLK